MEKLELIDTAVKIGLGALIAGVFTIVGRILAFKRDLLVRRRERICGQLELANAAFIEVA